MSPIRIILEVNYPEEEVLVRQHHAFLQEMSELALIAPSGHIFDVCEEAVLEKGKEHNRRILEQTVQKRIESLEKKGPAEDLRMRSICVNLHRSVLISTTPFNFGSTYEKF